MGNYIKPLSAGVALIASDSTWIEGKAIQQLQTTAELDGMRRVVGLPDLHPGRGYPVGAAFFSVGRFYPALVGNDIGCGMALWETGLAPGKLSADKLEKRLGNLDLPLDETWNDCIEALELPAREHWRALGTIGGGNHFAELQQVETVFDQAALHALGLDADRLQLLVHSGSRGLGQAILQEHVSLHGHAGLLDGSLEASAYLARHADALRFAEGNRQLIARRILERLRCDGLELLDVNHNLVAPAQVDGVDGWLHRKGATPADQGVLVIPGSRGDYSYLVEPVPSAQSLFSLAHGAGRKWQRGECRERLAARFSVDQLGRTRLGSRVICGDRQLIYEEAPEAYKGIDSVVGALLEAGLLRLVARLKPVLTYKTRGGVLPMILLQLSAAQGPAECCLAVAKAFERLCLEAAQAGVEVEVLEEVAGERPRTWRSLLLGLRGIAAEALAEHWCGGIQWICTSPYRARHARKNWFIGAERFAAPPASLEGEIRFETLRSSGPGGQHVNTTDSAVRATHLASGISVRVQSQRSQHANKRLAILLIARRLADQASSAADALRAERRQAHGRISRGAARRVFRGERFEPA